MVKLYGDAEYAVHVTGRPDPADIHTCYVERHYATMRGSMRWYTRRTNGFSRKLENRVAMLAVRLFSYNFRAVAPEPAGGDAGDGREHYGLAAQDRGCGGAG